MFRINKPSRAFALGAIACIPFAFIGPANADDDDEAHEHSIAKTSLLRPVGIVAPDANALGIITVFKEDDEQGIEFRAQNLPDGFEFFVFLETKKGSGSLLGIGEMDPENEFKDDDDSSDDDSSDDDSSDDDSSDDDSSDDDDIEDDEAEMTFALAFQLENDGDGFLPFGVNDVQLLAGRRAEVRDQLGRMYLAGFVPDLSASQKPRHRTRHLDAPGPPTGRLRMHRVPKQARETFDLRLGGLKPNTTVIVRITDPDGAGVIGTTTVPLKSNGKGKLRTCTTDGQMLPFGKKSLKQFSDCLIEVRDAQTSKVLMKAKIPKM